MATEINNETIVDPMVDMLKKMAANEELWDAVALSYRNLWDALIRAGFNHEQAMEIITSQGNGIKLA